MRWVRARRVLLLQSNLCTACILPIAHQCFVITRIASSLVFLYHVTPSSNCMHKTVSLQSQGIDMAMVLMTFVLQSIELFPGTALLCKKPPFCLVTSFTNQKRTLQQWVTPSFPDPSATLGARLLGVCCTMLVTCVCCVNRIINHPCNTCL